MPLYCQNKIKENQKKRNIKSRKKNKRKKNVSVQADYTITYMLLICSMISFLEPFKLFYVSHYHVTVTCNTLLWQPLIKDS